MPFATGFWMRRAHGWRSRGSPYGTLKPARKCWPQLGTSTPALCFVNGPLETPIAVLPTGCHAAADRMYAQPREPSPAFKAFNQGQVEPERLRPQHPESQARRRAQRRRTRRHPRRALGRIRTPRQATGQASRENEDRSAHRCLLRRHRQQCCQYGARYRLRCATPD